MLTGAFNALVKVNLDVRCLRLFACSVNLSQSPHTAEDRDMNKPGHHEEMKIVGCKLPPCEREAVQAAARQAGKSVNAWLQALIREKLEKGSARAA